MTINQERFTTYESLFPVLRTQTTSVFVFGGNGVMLTRTTLNAT